MANSVDPDQTAPIGAVCSGSMLFASILKGDISRFSIFLCKFHLYVRFYVFIKNPDHFPQCSVIK